MRLIDADKFKGKVIASHTGSGVIKLVAIDDVPTAYDPDKVLEQLEDEKEFAYADFDEYVNEVCPYLDAEYDDLFNEGLERAIEIVKGGGVDAKTDS